MRKSKVTIGIMLMTLITVSCNDSKKEQKSDNGQASEMMKEMDMDNMDHDGMMTESSQETSKVTAIIDHYLELKNALVADNTGEAATAGKKVYEAFAQFDRSSIAEAQQQEVEEIFMDAMEHAEHIGGNEGKMEHQREHFDILSVDVKDLLAITSTDRKLYQAFCPMYNEGKGAIWLSYTEEIKNPYFGSEMLTCGTVQEVIQ